MLPRPTCYSSSALMLPRPTCYSSSALLLPSSKLLHLFCPISSLPPTAPHPIYCSFPVLLLLFCSTAPLATYFSSSALQCSPFYYLFLSFCASSTLYFCHSQLLLLFSALLFYCSPFYRPTVLLHTGQIILYRQTVAPRTQRTPVH